MILPNICFSSQSAASLKLPPAIEKKTSQDNQSCVRGKEPGDLESEDQTIGGRSIQTEYNGKTIKGQSVSIDSPLNSSGEAQQRDSCIEGRSPLANIRGPEAPQTSRFAKYCTCPSGDISRCRLTGEKIHKDRAATSIMAFKRIVYFNRKKKPVNFKLQLSAISDSRLFSSPLARLACFSFNCAFRRTLYPKSALKEKVVEMCEKRSLSAPPL